MNILITGAAGFIGFNFSKNLLKQNKNIKVVGIDNISSYYSIKLKKERIKYLNKNKNFKFYKLDLKNKNYLEKLFKKFKFAEVYNFAAQAGVRYSSINPDAYMETNVNGFNNLLSISRITKVKKFIYASSSSVYGDTNKYPIKESQKPDPKNLYGMTKKYNEELAEFYYQNFGFPSIGLRFFTVFGEWGRPDMFIFKLLNASYKNKTFNLNNNGNHFRDFTYIDDVIEIITKLRNKRNRLHKIYNICSNKPIGLKKIIQFYKSEIPRVKIELKPKLKEDIYKTHGSNKKILKIIKKFKFTKTNISLQNTLNWYKKNQNLFN